MSINTREYIQRVVLTRDKVNQLRQYQNAVYNHAFINSNSSALSTAVSACSGILSLVTFIRPIPTAVSIASSLIGVVSAMAVPNEKDVFELKCIEFTS